MNRATCTRPAGHAGEHRCCGPCQWARANMVAPRGTWACGMCLQPQDGAAWCGAAIDRPVCDCGHAVADHKWCDVCADIMGHGTGCDSCDCNGVTL